MPVGRRTTRRDGAERGRRTCVRTSPQAQYRVLLAASSLSKQPGPGGNHRHKTTVQLVFIFIYI